MLGFALSADDIKTAPPEVRRWLEQQVGRSSDKEPKPKPIDPPTAPLIGCDAASVVGAEGSFAHTGDTEMNQKCNAVGHAAIQKLIAERAYELWENQGRPHGCDLIHWREAEQDIMNWAERPSHPPGDKPTSAEQNRGSASNRPLRPLPRPVVGP
jgi:hypothetical protein